MQEFKPGDRVRITERAKQFGDDAFVGQEGTFVQYAKPHGFAQVDMPPIQFTNAGDLITIRIQTIHPECLEKIVEGKKS